VSSLRAVVIATDEQGRRRAVGPVLPVNADRLHAAITGHGWTVTGTAVHVSVAAFRAMARDRARRGGDRP
jgi:hypothetical protein